MKLPKSISNWISITGFIIAINSFILILVSFVQDLFTAHPNPYTGIFTYIILPAIMVIGIIMILAGMIINRRKTHDPENRWPVLDMNSPRQRQKFVVVSIFIFFFLIISAVGSYEAFTYTESVEFCGKLCHNVMEPEYVTYMHSPHARVACVECHVGEGAGWYVRSKLSGLYQVYSVLFHKYPQPIETPIHNLRPARETCERCHWPQKFYSRKLRSQRVYLTDSLNTEVNYNMLMRIGPNYSPMGLKEGIHWHINKDMHIEYIASSKDRELIPWVKFTNLKTGEVQIFQDSIPENMLTQKQIDTLEHRTMDCMDCHNRPSHAYKSPRVYVDNGLISGDIPKELPFIKKISMHVLKGSFTNKDSAFTTIRDSINYFYKTKHPEIFKTQKPLIDKAIAGILDAFSQNEFPFMRAKSDKYLNHIGHLESYGCFRCHSDRHKSEKGKVIPKDCNMCHTIIAQGVTGKIQYSTIDNIMEFQHPQNPEDPDVTGDGWKTGYCTECHKILYR